MHPSSVHPARHRRRDNQSSKDQLWCLAPSARRDDDNLCAASATMRCCHYPESSPQIVVDNHRPANRSQSNYQLELRLYLEL